MKNDAGFEFIVILEVNPAKTIPPVGDAVKLSFVEEILAANPGTLQPFPKGTIWLSLCLCLPSILGFLAFLFSFPIDRQIPFWPHATIVVIFVQWFLFITPVTTAIAIITLIKRRRAREMTIWV